LHRQIPNLFSRGGNHNKKHSKKHQNPTNPKNKKKKRKKPKPTHQIKPKLQSGKESTNLLKRKKIKSPPYGNTTTSKRRGRK